MPNSVKPIPDDYRGAIPYLNVNDGIGAVEFYKKAFGASERIRILRKDGKLAHGELKIGEATIMLRDEIPEMNFLNPQSVGGTPSEILIYVCDVDALVKQASAAGAKVVAPTKEQFHGDFMAILEDPFGHSWFFATRIVDLSPEELRERAAEWGI
jgi:PhnB protein